MNLLHFVAYYNGLQSGFGIRPDFDIWTLKIPVRGLIVGSTYSDATIEAALEAGRIG